MCDMSHSHVWHVSFTCVTCLIQTCDMPCSYVWHVSFICVTRLYITYVCGMPRSHVWHDSFTRVTRRIRMPHLLFTHTHTLHTHTHAASACRILYSHIYIHTYAYMDTIQASGLDTESDESVFITQLHRRARLLDRSLAVWPCLVHIWISHVMHKNHVRYKWVTADVTHSYVTWFLCMWHALPCSCLP